MIRMTDLEPVLLTLDGPVGAIPGYVHPEISWNGFACPYFTLEALNAHRATFVAWMGAGVEDEDGTITIAGVPGESPSVTWPRDGVPVIAYDYGDGDGQDEVGEPVETADGVTLYTPGSHSWVWQIARPAVDAEIACPDGVRRRVLETGDTSVVLDTADGGRETVPTVCLALGGDDTAEWSYLGGSLEAFASGRNHFASYRAVSPTAVDVPGFIWDENRPAFAAGWLEAARERIAEGFWQVTGDYVDGIVEAESNGAPVEIAARVRARTIVGRGVEITLEDEEGMCMVVLLEGDGFQNLVESVLGE